MQPLVKKNRLLWNWNANMTLYSSKRTRNRPKSEHISFYRLNVWVSVKFISTYFSRDWVIKSLGGDMPWRATPLQVILVSSERDQEVSLSFMYAHILPFFLPYERTVFISHCKACDMMPFCKQTRPLLYTHSFYPLTFGFSLQSSAK